MKSRNIDMTAQNGYSKNEPLKRFCSLPVGWYSEKKLREKGFSREEIEYLVQLAKNTFIVPLKTRRKMPLIFFKEGKLYRAPFLEILPVILKGHGYCIPESFFIEGENKETRTEALQELLSLGLLKKGVINGKPCYYFIPPVDTEDAMNTSWMLEFCRAYGIPDPPFPARVTISEEGKKTKCIVDSHKSDGMYLWQHKDTWLLTKKKEDIPDGADWFEVRLWEHGTVNIPLAVWKKTGFGRAGATFELRLDKTNNKTVLVLKKESDTRKSEMTAGKEQVTGKTSTANFLSTMYYVCTKNSKRALERPDVWHRHFHLLDVLEVNRGSAIAVLEAINDLKNEFTSRIAISQWFQKYGIDPDIYQSTFCTADIVEFFRDMDIVLDKINNETRGVIFTFKALKTEYGIEKIVLRTDKKLKNLYYLYFQSLTGENDHLSIFVRTVLDALKPDHLIRTFYETSVLSKLCDSSYSMSLVIINPRHLNVDTVSEMALKELVKELDNTRSLLIKYFDGLVDETSTYSEIAVILSKSMSIGRLTINPVAKITIPKYFTDITGFARGSKAYINVSRKVKMAAKRPAGINAVVVPVANRMIVIPKTIRDQLPSLDVGSYLILAGARDGTVTISKDAPRNNNLVVVKNSKYTASKRCINIPKEICKMIRITGKKAKVYISVNQEKVGFIYSQKPSDKPSIEISMSDSGTKFVLTVTKGLMKALSLDENSRVTFIAVRGYPVVIKKETNDIAKFSSMPVVLECSKIKGKFQLYIPSDILEFLGFPVTSKSQVYLWVSDELRLSRKKSLLPDEEVIKIDQFGSFIVPDKAVHFSSITPEKEFSFIVNQDETMTIVKMIHRGRKELERPNPSFAMLARKALVRIWFDGSFWGEDLQYSSRPWHGKDGKKQYSTIFASLLSKTHLTENSFKNILRSKDPLLSRRRINWGRDHLLNTVFNDEDQSFEYLIAFYRNLLEKGYGNIAKVFFRDFPLAFEEPHPLQGAALRLIDTKLFGVVNEENTRGTKTCFGILAEAMKRGDYYDLRRPSPAVTGILLTADRAKAKLSADPFFVFDWFMGEEEKGVDMLFKPLEIASDENTVITDQTYGAILSINAQNYSLVSIKGKERTNETIEQKMLLYNQLMTTSKLNTKQRKILKTLGLKPEDFNADEERDLYKEPLFVKLFWQEIIEARENMDDWTKAVYQDAEKPEDVVQINWTWGYGDIAYLNHKKELVIIECKRTDDILVLLNDEIVTGFATKSESKLAEDILKTAFYAAGRKYWETTRGLEHSDVSPEKKFPLRSELNEYLLTDDELKGNPRAINSEFLFITSYRKSNVDITTDLRQHPSKRTIRDMPYYGFHVQRVNMNEFVSKGKELARSGKFKWSDVQGRIIEPFPENKYGEHYADVVESFKGQVEKRISGKLKDVELRVRIMLLYDFLAKIDE